MSAEEIDLVDEILSAGTPPVQDPAPPRPARRRARARSTIGLVIGLIFSFVLGTAGSLGLLSAGAVGVTAQYADKVIPGVHVGSLDVSGMTRDELIASLRTAYAYLGQGDVTIATPAGSRTLTFAQLGRGPDLESMANAALQIGHTGNPILDGITMLQSRIGGETVPIAVRVNSVAVAIEVRNLAATSRLEPESARVTLIQGFPFLGHSSEGGAVDQVAVARALVENLSAVDAPAHLQIGETFVTLEPAISDAQASAAMSAAAKMSVDLTLSLDPSAASISNVSNALAGHSSAAPLPGSATQSRVKTYVVPAATVRSWINFGLNPDGTYGTTFDTAAMKSYLATLSGTVTVPPVEPTVVFDSSGKPASLKGGKDGVGMDIEGTSKAITHYLENLAKGDSAGPVSIVAGPVSPGVNVTNLSDFVVMAQGQGAWTTIFYPGITNGNGLNIRTPAKILNGQVVAPGQRFSFLKAMGPIDRAHGFTLGGVIMGGKSDHTGAMGGGICSASTTMFNAAARAGLQIDERHQHYYYIDRYPVGLDATVYSNGFQVWDLKWTNDTPNPIVIRSWATYGGTSRMTVQLWSLPLDRKVTFSPAFKANIVRATNHTVYVTWLKPGQVNWAEYPTAGFSTSRTRTVTDSTGKVIHHDTWVSHYTKVDGLIQIGKKAPPPSP